MLITDGSCLGKKNVASLTVSLAEDKSVLGEKKISDFSYLFLLCTLQVPPLLSDMTEVHCVHRNLIFPNDIMFGETIEVINCHH